jgi:predicted TIM-barrel fold metal-dependent hydrolase
MKQITYKGFSKQNHTTEWSRRNFVFTTGLALAGAVCRTNVFGAAMDDDSEPIIDIHQHTDYDGRNNEDILKHQRAMGVTKTILLPAGRPVNSPSTHNGLSNGLQDKATGNKVCYQFAKEHPGEFLFGANEVPELPGAVKEIEKYLKKGAVVIGESKFGVECDSLQMQEIYRLAEEYNVPVLMHWQYNMYNYGFERFHTMLEKFPKVNFIGHAQTWWANTNKEINDQTIMYPTGKVTPGGFLPGRPDHCQNPSAVFRKNYRTEIVV